MDSPALAAHDTALQAYVSQPPLETCHVGYQGAVRTALVMENSVAVDTGGICPCVERPETTPSPEIRFCGIAEESRIFPRERDRRERVGVEDGPVSYCTAFCARERLHVCGV